MYKFIVNDNGLSGEIFFHGNLTVKNALKIKESLSEAFDRVRELFINHNEATGFDIAYIQLLVGLHNSAALLGKTIKWSYPKLFITFIKDAGLSGCHCLTNTELINEWAEYENE